MPHNYHRLSSEPAPPNKPLDERFDAMPLPITGRKWYAPLVLVFSLALTASTTTSLYWIIKKHDSTRFNRAVENLGSQIAQHLATYSLMLDGAASLVTSQERIDRHTLQVYIEHLHLRERYPGVQGIGWSVRVPAGTDSDLLAWFHAQGFTQILSLPPWAGEGDIGNSQPIPGAHHAIALIEPFDAGNLPILGFDMSSLPAGRVAMQAACDQNRVVATDQTTLRAMRDDRSQNGFVLFTPVYKGSVPDDPAGRRAALSGFIFAQLRSDVLLSGIPDLVQGPLSFSLSDAHSEPLDASVIRATVLASRNSPAPAIFYQTPLRNDDLPNAWLTTSRNLPAAGRTWTINARSTPAFEAASHQALVPWVGGSGIILSLALFALARAHARGVNRSSRLHHQCVHGQQTAEINLDISQRLARSLDLPAVVQSVIDGGCELTGASVAAFVVPTKEDVQVDGMSVYAEKSSGEEVGLAMPGIRGLLAATMTGHEVIRLADVRVDARYRSGQGSHSIISYFAAPVCSRTNQVAGVLVFAHTAPGHFTSDHERLLLGLAAQAAIAIDNAQLFQAESATRKIASQRAADLIRTNAELQQFVYVSSHDLQEPLRTITQYLDLLHRRHGAKLDAQALRYIDYASDSATRMYLLLNDLLTYSRIGRDAEREPVPLQEVWDDVCADLSVRIAEVRAEIISGELPTVFCERSKIRLVMQNLLSNALKFQNRTTPRCAISAECDGAGTWVISVIDNGIGIGPEYHALIFEVFERLHDRDSFPGTGIGLAICRKVIEQHGGKIWVECPVEGGSSFRFSIPDHSSLPQSKYLPAVITASFDPVKVTST